GERAVTREGADREIVTKASDNLAQNFLNELGSCGRDRGQESTGAIQFERQGDFMQMLEGVVDRFQIHLDDLLALLAVGLLDGILDGLDGLLTRQNAGKSKKADLHDCVDASPHPAVAGYLGCIDDVELNLLGQERFLDGSWQLLPNLVLWIGA